MISYAILVHNEHKELTDLLTVLYRHIDKDDELVIVADNPTVEISKILNQNAFIKYYERDLNKDFAAQKNYLTSKCTKEYIFNIDADEIPNEYLLSNLKVILKNNPNIDVYQVPRINTVQGITDEHIKKWHWSVRKFKFDILKRTKVFDINSKEYQFLNKKAIIINRMNIDKINIELEYYDVVINFADYQNRIYKNNNIIRWIKPVHEHLDGYKFISKLPNEEEYCIYHFKEIKKQEEQNMFYSQIN